MNVQAFIRGNKGLMPYLCTDMSDFVLNSKVGLLFGFHSTKNSTEIITI
jgi:hypothetical protein